MHSVSSRASSRQRAAGVSATQANNNRHSRRSGDLQRSNTNNNNQDWMYDYEEQMAENEMHLPYWERRAYRSYKQIKVLQP